MTDATTITNFLLELLDIIETNTESMQYTSKHKLKSKVIDCYNKHTIRLTKEISLTNPKKLTSELEDSLKYKLGEMVAEELTEECCSFKLTKNKLTTTIIALKRKA